MLRCPLAEITFALCACVGIISRSYRYGWVEFSWELSTDMAQLCVDRDAYWFGDRCLVGAIALVLVNVVN